jgi:hypothetical protein
LTLSTIWGSPRKKRKPERKFIHSTSKPANINAGRMPALLSRRAELRRALDHAAAMLLSNLNAATIASSSGTPISFKPSITTWRSSLVQHRDGTFMNRRLHPCSIQVETFSPPSFSICGLAKSSQNIVLPQRVQYVIRFVQSFVGLFSFICFQVFQEPASYM